MIERMTGVPAGIDALRADGKVTREDYDAVVAPLVEEAVRTGRRLRCLSEVGRDFHGMSPAAAWEDVTLGRRALRLIDGAAVVSDLDWIRGVSRVAAYFMPCPVRVFDEDERDRAIEWLTSLPEGTGMGIRLVPELGVVVVEVDEPLRATAFDALAATVDGWLDTHDRLPGLVLHARAFPGWENTSGLLRHLRFARDHHRRVRRVAVAVDGTLVGVALPVVRHLVRPQVRRFGYDQLDAAISWAGSAS